MMYIYFPISIYCLSIAVLPTMYLCVKIRWGGGGGGRWGRAMMMGYTVSKLRVHGMHNLVKEVGVRSSYLGKVLNT